MRAAGIDNPARGRGVGGIGDLERVLALGHRVKQRRAREEASELSVLAEHREFVLRGADQGLRGHMDRIGGAQALEAGDHRIARHQPLGHRARADILALGLAGEEHEDGDQKQHEIARGQPPERKQERHELARRGGGAGGLDAVHAGGECRAQDPSAIHRESWDQIEDRQDQINRRQLRGQGGRCNRHPRQLISFSRGPNQQC